VALVRTGVSEEHIASIIRVTRIGELGVFLRSLLRLLVTADVLSSPIFVTLMMEAVCSTETLVLTRATRSHITEDGIRHSHRHENLKSYKKYIVESWISDKQWNRRTHCIHNTCRYGDAVQITALTITGFLGFVHRPEFEILDNTTFRKLDLFLCKI
jgi:hypothetical protein